MVRLVRMSGSWYGVTIDDVEALEDDAANIGILAEEGNVVVVVDELETAEEALGIDPASVTMAAN